MITTTSKEAKETEVVKVTGISNGGKTITFTPALKFEHLGKFISASL